MPQCKKEMFLDLYELGKVQANSFWSGHLTSWKFWNSLQTLYENDMMHSPVHCVAGGGGGGGMMTLDVVSNYTMRKSVVTKVILIFIWHVEGHHAWTELWPRVQVWSGGKRIVQGGLRMNGGGKGKSQHIKPPGHIPTGRRCVCACVCVRERAKKEENWPQNGI